MAVARVSLACVKLTVCRTNLASLCSCRALSTGLTLTAGQKWRLKQGQAPDGIAYGPLTDLPDWSYADGRPAPETKARRKRKLKRLDVADRIQTLLREVDETAKRDEYTGKEKLKSKTVLDTYCPEQHR